MLTKQPIYNLVFKTPKLDVSIAIYKPGVAPTADYIDVSYRHALKSVY